MNLTIHGYVGNIPRLLVSKNNLYYYKFIVYQNNIKYLIQCFGCHDICTMLTTGDFIEVTGKHSFYNGHPLLTVRKEQAIKILRLKKKLS